jgi:hypothetical protein
MYQVHYNALKIHELLYWERVIDVVLQCRIIKVVCICIYFSLPKGHPHG